MDPNVNLQEQRRIVARMNTLETVVKHKIREGLTVNEICDSIDSDCVRLAELSQALDEWISQGGFLPNEWSRK